MTALVTGPVDEAHRADYLELLATADQAGAVEFATGLLDEGVPAEGVLVDLIARSQATVGDRWARAEWSIAQEHAATHISEQVVAAVAARTPRPRGTSTRGTVVVACVDGEWHALPAKLFAEVIRLYGWEVRFLGASVPGPHLISYLHQHGPDVLAVSCSLPTRLTTAHRLIEAAREAGVPVIAGGAGFGPDARWGRRLGADRVAVSATDAVAQLETWPGALSMPFGDPPPHVSDEEHRLVAKRRNDLVAAGMQRLAERYPAVASYTDAQREATRFDLEQIVEFLAAALFVDDASLFTSFVDWLLVVLGARHVPVVTVGTLLEAYTDALYDFPRAQSILRAGRDRLDAHD